MRRIAATLAVTTIVTAAAIGGALPAMAAHGTAAHSTASAESFYLSLGDSLAQGVQPNPAGVSVETNQGYADQLFTALRLGNPSLHLVKLGCPGETTTTMINGGICHYPKVSQLAQAVAFLKSNQGHVELVTIDIGANDLNPCLKLTSIPKIVACLSKVIPRALKNLATILGTLRAATTARVQIVGMTYYDPELADWLKGTNAGRTLAADSIVLAKAFDADLASVYTKFSVPVADIFTAFHTAAFKTMVTLPAFGRVPKDVAEICSLTWMCAAPPVGPNIHANRLGYGVIANALLQTILGASSAS